MFFIIRGVDEDVATTVAVTGDVTTGKICCVDCVFAAAIGLGLD